LKKIKIKEMHLLCKIRNYQYLCVVSHVKNIKDMPDENIIAKQKFEQYDMCTFCRFCDAGGK
jgi:hypothetical protein